MKWFDHAGREVDLAALKQEQAAPVVGGLRRAAFASHPSAGLTPIRLAKILRQSIDSDPEQYLALAEDMEERDPHYLSVISTRKGQVAGLEVTVDAAGDDARSLEIADAVRDAVARDSFEAELRDVLDATGKGFSATEIIWETSERQWMPKRLAYRDPRWFRFAPIDGETPLLRQPTRDEPLKPFGWVFHSFKAKSGLPIRGGLARAATWTYLFKSFTAKDWAIFLEAYGQPMRLGKYGQGATQADQDKLLEAVANIGTDYAAVVPNSMAIEFVTASLTGNHEVFEKRSDWLDRQISKMVLGQTSTTDAQKGSYAVGRVHDEVRGDIEKADAKSLAATLNRDYVRPFVDLNYGPQPRYPKLRIGRTEEVDTKEFMDNVRTFVGMGGRVGMSTVRDKIGLPDPGDDEELLSLPRGKSESPQPAEQSAHAAARPATKDAVDDAVADALADWEPLVGPIVDGLAQAIAGARTLDEVRRLLAERFEGMDVGVLQEQLARAAFAARLAGENDEPLS